MTDRSFSQPLLSWYRKHRRDLPWRRTSDPYKIWVSEIMLQQTTVETVIPYYEKFLKRFPTVRSLAKAPEEEVLGQWSGLGYYSRARNLRNAAARVTEGFKGKIPKLPEDLQTLPGIGRYTAGAIASIAFGVRAPIVDGNVIRVLSRIFALQQDPKTTEGQKIFWKKAEEVLPQKDCGDFNQALMELGATTCLPTRPLCLFCPVSKVCQAGKEGSAEEYPKGKKKVVYQEVRMTAAVVRQDEKILMIRRPDKGLLKGMWEVPMIEGDLAKFLKEWPIEPIGTLPSVRHSVLNRRLTIAPIVGHLKRPLKKGIVSQWLPLSQIYTLATSSMVRKILRDI